MQLDLFLEMNNLALQAELQTELWKSLDDEERTAVVVALARLMAKALVPQEEDDE